MRILRNVSCKLSIRRYRRQGTDIPAYNSNEEGAAVVVKIFESEKIYESHQLATGTIVTDGKKFMKVAVPDGFVSILSLQLPGKKRLKIDELLRGYHLEDGCLMK